MAVSQIHNEASFFECIALIWVKTHIGHQDLFEALNDQVDHLCQEKNCLAFGKPICPVTSLTFYSLSNPSFINTVLMQSPLSLLVW